MDYDGPVSYTHLDVYKRQKYGRTQFVCGRFYDPSDYSGDIGISHIPKGDDRSKSQISVGNPVLPDISRCV